MEFTKGLSIAQRVLLILAALFYTFAGVNHFLQPEFYLKMMPSYLPWHAELVQISGVCEALGGLGLLLPQTRRLAAWGLVALLVAVFPANLYMATNPVEAGATAIAPAIRWGRLPFQVLFIWWILWCSKARVK